LRDEIDDWVNRLIEGDEAFQLRKENEMLAGHLPGSCSLHIVIENSIAQQEASWRFRESRSPTRSTPKGDPGT
jgi:hypothetical protein